MPELIQPIILSGGAGTRLWPLSRKEFPKQFLSLTGAESLFQQAVKRLVGFGAEGTHVANPIVVSGEDHRFIVSGQLRDINVELGMLLLEPVARNTAPALTLAAIAAQSGGLDPVMIVTPADHIVADIVAFEIALHRAVSEADRGAIVALGVMPETPETGYGYIEIAGSADHPVTAVKRFVEKPDAATAQSYLSKGGFYWNAGIFVLKASVWLKALECFRPDIFNSTQRAWRKRKPDPDLKSRFVRPGKSDFSRIPSESIDYAVMEHCPNSAFRMKMVKLDAGWSDLGAWNAVWGAMPKDGEGNAYYGDVISKDCRGALVHSTSRLVALLGVENLVVVEAPDVVLVADRTRSQYVRQIIDVLEHEKRAELNYHRKIHRPWGWYDSIDKGTRFQVKRIHVKPGASLSMQKHLYRAEHWVVVRGNAEIIRGEKKMLLTENQSIFIPRGEVHRLSNPGDGVLEIIEVQLGTYLGEDDIIRIEDEYGRSRA
jgi:mannose-1-phosphate guanylyltransferase/mannose-6-phosphate isomerase